MTITTTAPTITATGISAPTFADLLDYLQTQFRAIYGADVYLGNDSQDGQWLGVIAQAIYDANATAILIYTSFSPATGQGEALASNVKINGITRNLASFSTVDLQITGQNGTTINNGVVTDISGVHWNLPAVVVIPGAGTITVTATCQTLGAIAAAANTVNVISTPTLGWQGANNAAAAAPGAPVETDAQLRKRQIVSTALPSQSILDGIVGSVSQLPGVNRLQAYENPTGSTDSNGLPAHSMSFVVEGGDAVAIARQIALKKTPGTATYGTTVEVVADAYLNAITINFYRPTTKLIAVAITVKALSGYSSVIGDQIKAALAAYINTLAIGQSVLLTRLYLPANLNGGTGSTSFEVTVLQIAISPATPIAADVTIAFNEVATCDIAHITLTVV